MPVLAPIPSIRKGITMSVKMNAQCLACLFKRNVDAAAAFGTEDELLSFAKELMKQYLTAPEGVSAPWFGPVTNELLCRHFGLEWDRFRREKADSNRFILERMDAIRAKVTAAPDPVYAGLQFAVLGNYIDFAALRGEVSFARLDEMLESALEMDLDRANYASFCKELETGKKLLYVTDNAGEIGFDRIFAEELRKKFPHLEITFCVRGGPAANDATREDAAAVSIPFPVIDNGNLVAGTELSLLGDEAKLAFDAADVILSKGQGNVETLLGCGYNIYYAFLIKCPLFEKRFHKKKLTPMFLKERP